MSNFSVYATENANNSNFACELFDKYLFDKRRYTGTWQGPDTAININKTTMQPQLVNTIKTITLVCGDDGDLQGTVSYTTTTGTGHDETGASVTSDTENVIGFVDKVNGLISMVEWAADNANAETGSFTGHVTNDGNILKLTQTQTASDPVRPLVSKMELPRV